MTFLEPGKNSVAEHPDDAERADSRPRTRSAALICYRDNRTAPITVEWTYWDGREQARQAEAELTPCGPQCIGVHSVVRVDGLSEPRHRAGHR